MSLTSLPTAHADGGTEPFFTSLALCPMAHCNAHLDGRELLNGAIVTLPVSTPPSPTAVATYTPPTPIAYNSSLGCTAGGLNPTAAPNLVECDGTQAKHGPSSGPFVYNLTAGGDATHGASLSLNWSTLAYQPGQTLSCTTPPSFGMAKYVIQGAPLFGDYGNTYVSDDEVMAKFTPSGASGLGVCAWATPNPYGAAMISWNAVHLPANGGPGGYPGGYYVVGQGTAGPVVLANDSTGATETLALSDPTTGLPAVTFNTVAVVTTATGARVYDSTADCAAGSGCSVTATVPGVLFAIDITSPNTAGGTPTMQVAWSYSFAGPSGASPMVYTPSSGAPGGDRIFFDGGGDSCTPSCPSPHPHLFELLDNCAFGDQHCSTDGGLPSLKMDQDFTLLGEDGSCPTVGYLGIQAAALEAPEKSGDGTDPNYSVWAFAACGSTLYRFDAVTGDLWPSGGGGVGSIDIPTATGLSGYIPGSTMETVIDSHTGHTTMFVGAQALNGSDYSYVTALDLETGNLFWKVHGPTTVGNADDTPFNGQFPIAQTTSGGNILIATTRGQDDGGTILAIPLS